MSHSFKEKTFGHLTYCGVCSQLLWGVIKQGLECRECQYVCHRKCQSSASKCSKAAPTRFLESSIIDSRAEEYLRQLKQKTDVEADTTSSSTAVDTVDTHAPPPERTRKQKSTYQLMRAIATSNKLHTILADSITTNNNEPVNAYLANQPPLNTQLTAKNFSRFVSRCGPVYKFRDEMILLISWNNRVDTFISLLVYCGLCLYPKLILFIPQVALFYFILYNYSRKKTSSPKMQEKKSSTVGEKIKAKASKSTPIKKKSSEDPKTNLPDSLLSFGFATLFQPAGDESPEYLKNLQNIQNTMGEVSDVYDWIITQANRLNGLSEVEITFVLQAIILVTVMFGLIFYFIPLNWIFLSSGLMVYGINTRCAKYVIKELQPYIIQSSKQKVECIRQWYTTLENKYEHLEEVKEISVYENQRWWPMRGYLPEMLPGERPPWSDFTGSTCMSKLAENPAPNGYQWIEASEWKLDHQGPWVDDYLEIAPKQNGWIYSDDHWNIASPQIIPNNDSKAKQQDGAKTRRRRWIRVCQKIAGN